MANLIDLYIVYRILRKLTTPFEEWDAYKAGVIDVEGNLLKKSDKRTSQNEIDSYTPLDNLILKLKRLLAKIPGGSGRFATCAAALLLIKEEKTLTEDNVEECFLKYLKSDMLTEEIANNVGTGSIAGVDGNPPVGKKIMMRRFAGNDVFVVNSAKFNSAKLGKKKYLKYEKYVGSDDVGDAIRVYGRKYPKKPIIIQDELTGAMTFLRHGRSGMFTEKWESLSTKSYVDENAPLDKFKKYVRPVIKTIPKIEKTTNPSGRTTDHVEWKVTTHTGEIHRYNSKKEAQAHFDSLPK